MTKIFEIFDILLFFGVIHICTFNYGLGQEAAPHAVRRLGGTIRDLPSLNAQADAMALKGAMKGLGTSEQTVATIMTTRSIRDRVAIANAYKNLYHNDLGTKFKHEFSFHALEMLEDMLISPRDYDAQVIYSSMKGFGTDLDSITATLCSKDDTEIEEIKASYQRRYNKPLEKALQGDVSNPLMSLYSQLLNTHRESGPVNPSLVEQDVKAIMATDLKHFSPNNQLFKILASRSKEHIAQVVEAYKRQTNNILTTVLNQDYSGGITDQGKTVRTVKNLLECYVNPPKFYAQQIQNDIKGFGTKDKRLFRKLIQRSEIDLEDIKEEYKRLFREDLTKRLERDTSGTYQKMVKGILQGNRMLFPH